MSARIPVGHPHIRPGILPPEAGVVTGSASADHASSQPRSQMPAAFRLLREAAEAASAVWSGPLYPQPRDRAERQLCQALDDLRAISTELAAADHRPQLREFSRCLDQAWRCGQTMPAAASGEPASVRGEPGDVLLP